LAQIIGRRIIGAPLLVSVQNESYLVGAFGVVVVGALSVVGAVGSTEVGEDLVDDGEVR